MWQWEQLLGFEERLKVRTQRTWQILWSTDDNVFGCRNTDKEFHRTETHAAREDRLQWNAAVWVLLGNLFDEGRKRKQRREAGIRASFCTVGK